MNIGLKFVTVCGMSLLASSCWADMIYSDLGAGDAFNIASSSYIGGPMAQTVAARFVPGSTASFGFLRLAVESVIEPNGNYTVTLASDDNGAPGATLEAFSNLLFPTTAGILGISSTLNPQLLANTPYWVVVTGDGGRLHGAGLWFGNSFGQTGLDFQESGNANSWRSSTSSVRPAFEVDGFVPTVSAAAQTPEPASFALILAGAALISLSRLRRSRA